MKRSIFILTFVALTTASFLCLADEKESFTTFLNRFQTWQTPFGRVKNGVNVYTNGSWKGIELSSQVVKTFVCNAQNRDYSASKFLYAAGVKYQYDSLYVLVVGKSYYEPGNSVYTNLLGESLLVIYSNHGKQLSQTVLTQNSDGYYSDFYFENDSTIRVFQAGLIDEESVRIIGPKPIWVDYFQYTIHKDGKVSREMYKPRAKGLAVFEDPFYKITVNGKEVSAQEE